MSEIRSKIQHNISIYRKKAGLTQDELAEKLHVKKTSLASWEQGKSLPDIDTLFTLCDILQVNISVISGFEPQQSQHHLGDGVQHAINEFYQAVDSISEYSARVGHELTPSLSDDENQLIDDYREFNDEGKEKVRDYVADLADNPKYKKCSEPVLEKQA